MSMIFYEPGDQVYYPKWSVATSRTMTVKDRMILSYPSGKMYVRYLFEDLLDNLVSEMHENVERDLDNVLCISGTEGSGKSNLAYWVAKKYNPDFDMQQCYTLSFEDLLNRIHRMDADEGAIFWLDEATNISNNRDWMRSDNKAFITMLEMFRSRKWCLILCIPKFDRLDVYLRESRIRYSLHCEELGWEHNPEKKRGYFQLTKFSDRSDTGYREAIRIGYGRFDRIPAGDNQVYLQIKDQTQESKLDELYNEKNKKNRIGELAKMNRKLILHLYEDEHKTYDEIAEMTGLTASTIKGYLSHARREREEDAAA